MTRHFIPGIDDDYKFTRSEFAQLLGISSNALRMRMRKSKVQYDYVIKDGKYLFKRPHDYMVGRPSDRPSPSSLRLASTTMNKQKVRRGAHKMGKAQYPNSAFEMHNEMKILNSINKKFKNDKIRARFERLNEMALKKIEQEVEAEESRKLKDQIKDQQPTNNTGNSYMQRDGGVLPNKYGHMLNAEGLARAEKRSLSKHDRWDEEMHKTKFVQRYDYNGQLRNTSLVDFSDKKRGVSNPYWDNGPSDDGSVELSEYDMITKTTPNHLNKSSPDFSNEKNPCIAEAIWKLKNK